MFDFKNKSIRDFLDWETYADVIDAYKRSKRVNYDNYGNYADALAAYRKLQGKDDHFKDAYQSSDWSESPSGSDNAYNSDDFYRGPSKRSAPKLSARRRTMERETRRDHSSGIFAGLANGYNGGMPGDGYGNGYGEGLAGDKNGQGYGALPGELIGQGNAGGLPSGGNGQGNNGGWSDRNGNHETGIDGTFDGYGQGFEGGVSSLLGQGNNGALHEMIFNGYGQRQQESGITGGYGLQKPSVLTRGGRGRRGSSSGTRGSVRGRGGIATRTIY